MILVFPCSSPLLCDMIQILQAAICFMPNELNDQLNTSQDMSRQHDLSKYTLTVEEASHLFSNAGVPRSPRTIDRYCKSGHLVCVKIDTERNEKYLITPESVTERIKELQQVASTGHVEAQRDMSRHVESEPDMSRHDAMHDQLTNDEKLKLEERIRELERENFDLQITNRAKDYFVDELKKEREYFEAVRQDMTQKLIEQSQRVGELQVKVLQLEAPRHGHGKPTEDRSNVIDVTPENTAGEENREQMSTIQGV
jgi:hypothetical protein